MVALLLVLASTPGYLGCSARFGGSGGTVLNSSGQRQTVQRYTMRRQNESIRQVSIATRNGLVLTFCNEAALHRTRS